MKSYWQKLKDPKWQKKRLEIMQRDEFTCQACFEKDKTLNVHHRLYRKGKSPWEYDDCDLVTLCEDCHSKVTKENAEITEWLAGPSAIHSAIYSMNQLYCADSCHINLVTNLMSYIVSVHSCVFENDLQALTQNSKKLDECILNLIDDITNSRRQIEKKRTTHQDQIPIWKKK